MDPPSWSRGGRVVSRRFLALDPRPPRLWKAPTDGHRRDPPTLPRALRGDRSSGGALGVPARPGPDAVVRERRHGAVQALLPGPGDAAVHEGDERAEVRATPDIEDVGKTTRHGTFFEMCGNFSFGDYFKEGAIEYAWDLVTKPQVDGGWGLEESRLWPSVLHGDDEALALWMKVTGLPEHRIVRLGPKENYWSMGVPGPGGPCSEILYDRGPDHGPEADWEAMGTDMDPALEDRYLEIWNLVFMQDELSAVRSKSDFDIVGSLPKRNIDTGMGLERVAFLLQGVENMYEIDVMLPVIEKAEELTGKRYRADHG